MRNSAHGTVRRTAVGAVGAMALMGGAVACGGGDEAGGGSQRSAAQVITAAYKKTSEAKSAKVTMTMSMPQSMEGGGDVRLTGTMGWDPTLLDMTVEGSALAAADGPESMRMIWRDNVMYMDMGKDAAKDMDGKRWMKLDVAAAAEAAGDEKALEEMTKGLENMNQDPAKQLALLLDSPNLKHVGSEKVGGEEAEHYKGTLTVKEVLKSSNSLDLLDAKERKDLLKNIEKSGIKGYDTEVWVNEDDLPVRMDVDMDTPEGAVKMSVKFSDYGAKAEVKVPPAGETFDLLEMFTEMGEALGEEGFGEKESSGTGSLSDEEIDKLLEESADGEA